MTPMFTLTHLEAGAATLDPGKWNHTFHCFIHFLCTHKEEATPMVAIRPRWGRILGERTRWRASKCHGKHRPHTRSHAAQRQEMVKLLINIRQDEAICHLWHSFWGNPSEFKDRIKNETLIKFFANKVEVWDGHLFPCKETEVTGFLSILFCLSQSLPILLDL